MVCVGDEPHWYRMQEFGTGKKSDYYRCSKCKEDTYCEGGLKKAIDSLPVCPHCGADMTRYIYNVIFTDMFGSTNYISKDIPPNYQYRKR